jgi:hypothetical protein
MRARRVSRALARLPAVQREAVILFELEEYSVEEIAAMQKVSVGAVKSRISRGREKLRRQYEKLGFQEEGAGPVRRKRRMVRIPGGFSRRPKLAWVRTEGLPPLEKQDG